MTGPWFQVTDRVSGRRHESKIVKESLAGALTLELVKQLDRTEERLIVTLSKPKREEDFFIIQSYNVTRSSLNTCFVNGSFALAKVYELAGGMKRSLILD